MSASLGLLHFVQGLSERDRSLYLLLRAYELHATTYDSERLDVLSTLFRAEITNLLQQKVKTPVYQERSRNDQAEKSTIQFSETVPKMSSSPSRAFNLPKITIPSPNPLTTASPKRRPIVVIPKMNAESEQLQPRVAAIFDPFASKLGEWASSFSLDTDSDPQPHDSGSDLSSEEEIL